MKYRFLVIAAGLIVAALLVGYSHSGYQYLGGAIAPVNAFGLLGAGLAIAGGLSLIADALRERGDR